MNEYHFFVSYLLDPWAALHLGHSLLNISTKWLTNVWSWLVFVVVNYCVKITTNLHFQNESGSVQGLLLLSSFTSVISVCFSPSCRGAPLWDVQEWILLSRNGWVWATTRTCACAAHYIFNISQFCNTEEALIKDPWVWSSHHNRKNHLNAANNVRCTV